MHVYKHKSDALPELTYFRDLMSRYSAAITRYQNGVSAPNVIKTSLWCKNLVVIFGSSPGSHSAQSLLKRILRSGGSMSVKRLRRPFA